MTAFPGGPFPIKLVANTVTVMFVEKGQDDEETSRT